MAQDSSSMERYRKKACMDNEGLSTAIHASEMANQVLKDERNNMTVKELKEKLDKMLQDAEVIITVDWSSSVEKVEYHDADSHVDRPYVELS